MFSFFILESLEFLFVYVITDPLIISTEFLFSQTGLLNIKLIRDIRVRNKGTNAIFR